eukprot:6188453-Pleurochrysis_carterae.AAC.4
MQKHRILYTSKRMRVMVRNLAWRLVGTLGTCLKTGTTSPRPPPKEAMAVAMRGNLKTSDMTATVEPARSQRRTWYVTLTDLGLRRVAWMRQPRMESCAHIGAA